MSPTNHTRAYYFRPDDTDSGESMLVGEAGYVTLDVPAGKGTVLVPRLAVTRMDGEPTIFVQRDGEPEPLTVEIRGQFGTDYLIYSPDLEAGTRVVVRGAFNLKSQRILQ